MTLNTVLEELINKCTNPKALEFLNWVKQVPEEERDIPLEDFEGMISFLAIPHRAQIIVKDESGYGGNVDEDVDVIKLFREGFMEIFKVINAKYQISPTELDSTEKEATRVNHLWDSIKIIAIKSDSSLKEILPVLYKDLIDREEQVHAFHVELAREAAVREVAREQESTQNRESSPARK